MGCYVYGQTIRVGIRKKGGGERNREDLLIQFFVLPGFSNFLS